MSDYGPSSRRTTTAASEGAPARRTAECGLRAGRARWHGWTVPNCSTATSSSSAWCCPRGQPRTDGCFGGTTASAGCCSTTLSAGAGTTCSTAGTPLTDNWTTKDLRTPSRRASGSCARVTHCCAGSMRSHCDGVASRRRPPGDPGCSRLDRQPARTDGTAGRPAGRPSSVPSSVPSSGPISGPIEQRGDRAACRSSSVPARPPGPPGPPGRPGRQPHRRRWLRAAP